MVLLVFSPAVLLLVKKRFLAGMALSLAIYILAARTPWLNLPLISASGDHWLFDPFSWQLLFTMGIALGSRAFFARLHVPGKRTILCVIGFALAAIAILKSLAVVGKIYQIPSLAALSSLAALPGMDLRTVGPMRLLYFISLLFFLMGIMPSTETLRRIKFATPIIACGQSSLEILPGHAALRVRWPSIVSDQRQLSFVYSRNSVRNVGNAIDGVDVNEGRFHNAVSAFGSSPAASSPSSTLIYRQHRPRTGAAPTRRELSRVAPSSANGDPLPDRPAVRMAFGLTACATSRLSEGSLPAFDSAVARSPRPR